MRTEFILLIIIGAFFSALIFFLIILYRPALPTLANQPPVKKGEAAVSDPNSITELRNKVDWLDGQVSTIEAKVNAPTPTPLPLPTMVTGKTIIAVANTSGTSFTTTVTTYTPMGMYVNINCPKNCLLWINFYTSSKNTGNAVAQSGNMNSYDVFLDSVDQSIFTQASYPVPATSIPVSLNAAIAATAGFHTIDIRTKTSGGTLESDSSTLQVMAIEK